MGFSISLAQGARGGRRGMGTVDRRIVDHEHVERDVPAVPLERSEAAIEERTGVVVHDHDRELGGLGGDGDRHWWGVCATSTMPSMMKNTPAHRSGGICSCSRNRSAKRIRA